MNLLDEMKQLQIQRNIIAPRMHIATNPNLVAKEIQLYFSFQGQVAMLKGKRSSRAVEHWKMQ